ncbi:hypothetical protein Hanom_Chr09g00865701 [Helianthus anomalus]
MHPTTPKNSSLANDMVLSSLTSRRCFSLVIACETSPMEGRFLGVLCKHLCAICAKLLTSSGSQSPTSSLSRISSVPSELIAAF